MTTSDKTFNSSKNKGHFAEFDDQVLQKTFEEFYTDNQEESKSSIWNFSTIAGLGVVGISLLFVFQGVLTMLFGTAPNAFIDPEFMSVLPILSGITATVIGLGWFRRNKGKKKLSRAEKRALKNASKLDESFRPSSFEAKSYNVSSSSANKENNSEAAGNYPRFNRGQGTQSSSYERYAISKNNRLFKSRRDKVLSGVIGGIAKYVGIKPGILRLLFIFTFFMSGGVPLFFAYIILAFVLPKEPIILLDD